MNRPGRRIRVLLDECETGLAPGLDPARFDVVRVIDRLPRGTADAKVTQLAAADRRWLVTADRGIPPKIHQGEYVPARVVLTSARDAPAERVRKLNHHLPQVDLPTAPPVLLDLRKQSPRLRPLGPPRPPSPGDGREPGPQPRPNRRQPRPGGPRP